MELGTEEQKLNYLTRIHKDWLGAFCLSGFVPTTFIPNELYFQRHQAGPMLSGF
jgi:hypothetical protein